MRKSASWIVLSVFASIGLFAQAPGTSNNVKIDSPQAKVIVVAEQPHRRSAQHEHPLNRVMIYLDGGEMIETAGDGKTRKLEFKAGEVRWSPAQGPHTSEFSADHPIRIVEIELKNNSQEVAAFSPIDPLKADPKHYSLEFENNQVRVLRVRFGPHEEGVLHEHTLNHIVVYLNDQARGKPGDVRLDEPMTHTEQNPLDYAVERIAVDLK
jgi:quercetin dioxygenase-like cupin family protein